MMILMGEYGHHLQPIQDSVEYSSATGVLSFSLGDKNNVSNVGTQCFKHYSIIEKYTRSYASLNLMDVFLLQCFKHYFLCDDQHLKHYRNRTMIY